MNGLEIFWRIGSSDGETLACLGDFIYIEILEWTSHKLEQSRWWLPLAGIRPHFLPGSCVSVPRWPPQFPRHGQFGGPLHDAALRRFDLFGGQLAEERHLGLDDVAQALGHVRQELLARARARAAQGSDQVLAGQAVREQVADQDSDEHLNSDVLRLRQQIEVGLDHSLQNTPALQAVLAGYDVLHLLKRHVRACDVSFRYVRQSRNVSANARRRLWIGGAVGGEQLLGLLLELLEAGTGG